MNYSKSKNDDSNWQSHIKSLQKNTLQKMVHALASNNSGKPGQARPGQFQNGLQKN